MKTAIQIIRDAFTYAGIATGAPLNGRMSQEGLDFLNEVIYRLNSDNYFPFTNNTIDGKVKGGSAKISPDAGSEFLGEKPLNITRVLWKYGSEWVPLVRVGYDNIWERRCSVSKPTFFAFSNDSDGSGIITFDCEQGDFDCRVIYNKSVPSMDFNDELATPPQYEQLMKYGVAIKACIRYGLPADKIAGIQSEYDSILEAIKKNNSFKHEIDLPYLDGAGYYDDFSIKVLQGRHL